MEPLTIAGKSYNSRLILGTAQYPNPDTMIKALKAGGTELVTVALRRVDFQSGGENILSYLKEGGFDLLPNTAGCYTAKEAVKLAKMGREALGTKWVKLEVIGDDETLFPDVTELLKAAEELLAEGFVVLPYSNDDPITCKKLADMGCAAIMPLGAPIGSGLGIRNPHNLQIIRKQIDLPLIVDAGVGTASDSTFAMELGADALLMNSAISQAEHPVDMARAMKLAVESGYLARKAGRMPRRSYARATSPEEGLPDF